MRVAFLDPLEARLRDFPAQYLADHEVLTTSDPSTPPEGFENAEAIVWWNTPVNDTMIARMPRLRFAQRIGWFRSQGDATAALERGIPVAVTPFGVSDRVAQHGFTL
ncbi:MAG: hypothetical protein NTZ05_19265, partial [Chloroflexi bacterium]|nr:hypothetical protein [Chloroflexota bacterium]